MVRPRLWWLVLIVLSAVLLWLDYKTGPYVVFPVAFVVPAGLAARHLGRRAGWGFAVALSALRAVSVVTEGGPAAAFVYVTTNVVVRTTVLIIIVELVSRLTAAEALLRAHAASMETRLSAIVENAHDAILSKDLAGSILTWNRGAEKMFGYSATEAIGQSIRMLARHADFDEDAILTRVKNGELLNYESTRQTKNGTIIPVWLSVSPIRDSAGLIVAASTIIRDLTQRKNAEKRFETIVEEAPDAVIIVDHHGRIALANGMAETFFGYTRSELVGRDVEILVPEGLSSTHAAHRASYLSTPKPRAMGAGLDLRGRRKDGTLFPVEISLTPIEGNAGLLVVSTIRDITDRRQAERVVAASLREKEVLLREVHHRVKNNLAVISSLLYLQSIRSEDPQTLRILENCRNRVHSMGMVHERLYRSTDLSHIDFAEYVGELATTLHRNNVLRPEGIALHVSTTPIRLDIDQAVPCGLILNELMTNALKHAFPGDNQGDIRVSLTTGSDGWLTLSVADNGVGLPDAATTEGTGSIGMLIIQSLAKQLNGQIDFVRLHQGTDARFSLRSADADTH